MHDGPCSCIVGAWKCTCVRIRSTRCLSGCCLLLDGLALCDDEVHVSVDGEANDFLVERLRQTAGLEVEAEESLRVASV
jgi:hypothetical protein